MVNQLARQCNTSGSAGHADTIPYELFTWIGSRVKRLAIDPVDQSVAESTVRAA